MKVRLVCGVKGCHRPLGSIDVTPSIEDPAWRDPACGIWIESCRKHGGIATTIDDAAARRHERGMPEIDRSKLMHFVPWSDVQADVQLFASTRRVVTHAIEPQQRRI